MAAKQIMFMDLKEDKHHGGIQLDNGDVICGCCGGLFKANERGSAWELMKSFDDFWVPLDEEICGDDWFPEKK